MKLKETRLIVVNGFTCKFKIYDNCVIAFPGCNQLAKIVDMIRTGEDAEAAISRARATATRDWKDIVIFRQR